MLYHSKYTGNGSGKNDDYWDCYCILDGCKPPKDLETFLKHINNVDLVRSWWQEHKFNFILCHCWCCHGANPYVAYGFAPEYFEDPSETEEDYDLWTVSSRDHAFFVKLSGELIYHGEKIKLM